MTFYRAKTRMSLLTRSNLVLLIFWTTLSMQKTAGNIISDMMASDCSVDLAFVLDASGSVGTNNWKTMTDFVKAFANLLPLSSETNQVGVISFGNDATLHIPLNGFHSHKDFNNSMDNIIYKDENTNTASALRLLRTEMFLENAGDRKRRPNIAIVLTDGKPTYEINATTIEANRLKNDGTFVFAIGIGAEGINVEELVEIASEPESKFVFRILRFEDLTALLMTILEEVCKIQLPTDPETPKECSGKDIIFLLDSSGSVKEQNWQLTKEFLMKVLESISVEPGYNRIGIVTYSTESYMQSQLGQFSTLAELDGLVDTLSWINQRTNTSGALRLARQMFSLSNLQSHSDVIVLISDGKSNTDEALTIPEAENNKRNGIRIFSIGVGLDADMVELEGIASRPKKYHTYLVADLMQTILLDNELGLQNALCSGNYPPSTPSIANADCTSDVLFILDATLAIGIDRFLILKQALQQELQKLTYSGNRMAFIPFGSNPYLVPFNYFPADFIDNPIDQLRFLGGTGFNAQGLGEQIEKAIKERRADVVMPIIVITATEPVSGDGIDELFKNVKDVTKSPVYAVVLDAEMESVGMITSAPAINFLFEVNHSLARTIDHVLKMSCLAAANIVFHCDFETSDGEEDMCAITQSVSDKMDWIHHIGSTPSRHTGPDGAFSWPYYLYIEASKRQQGDDAVLYLPVSQQTSKSYCIYFAYHMHGFHIGSLQVIQIHNNRERILWMKYGPQSGEWEFSEVGMTLQPNDKVAFRAVRAGEYSGDIALDSIVVRSGPCPTDYPLDTF